MRISVPRDWPLGNSFPSAMTQSGTAEVAGNSSRSRQHSTTVNSAGTRPAFATLQACQASSAASPNARKPRISRTIAFTPRPPLRGRSSWRRGSHEVSQSKRPRLRHESAPPRRRPPTHGRPKARRTAAAKISATAPVPTEAPASLIRRRTPRASALTSGGASS